MRYAILLAMLPGCYIYNDPDTYSTVVEFQCDNREHVIPQESYCHAFSIREPESTPQGFRVGLYNNTNKTPKTLNVGRGGTKASDFVRCEGYDGYQAAWVQVKCFGMEGFIDEQKEAAEK